MVTFYHTLLCKACVRWEQLLPGGAEQVFSFFVFSKPSIFAKINLYIISDRGFASFKDYWTFTRNSIPSESALKCACRLCIPNWGRAGTRWCQAGRWLVCNPPSALHKRLSGCSMLQLSRYIVCSALHCCCLRRHTSTGRNLQLRMRRNLF